MRLSTRNQLTGTITKEAVEEFQLEIGSAAAVLVKSTEVMIGVE